MKVDYTYHYLSKIYDETKSVFWSDYSKILQPYIKSDSKILDLGCGTGLAIKYLNLPRTNYLGVDLSKDMLEIALSKFPDYQFKLESITDLNLNLTFDVIIMAFDTLNHLLSKKDWIQVFKVANKHLGPSSHFIFDMVTPFDHREVWPNYIDITESGNWLYIQRGDFNKNSERATLHTTIFEKDKDYWIRFDETIQQISFSVNNVKKMLEESGLQCQVCLDTNRGGNPHSKSNSVTFISKKLNN